MEGFKELVIVVCGEGVFLGWMGRRVGRRFYFIVFYIFLNYWIMGIYYFFKKINRCNKIVKKFVCTFKSKILMV